MRSIVNAKNILCGIGCAYVCLCVCVCFQPFRNAELLVLQVDEVDALFCYCTFTKHKKK